MATSLARTQRLRTLENHIRKSAEQIQKNGLEIGRDLCEIRDDELWRGDGFESWNHYLKDRAGELVGKSFAQATNLIRAAEISKRLPSGLVQSTGLTATALTELGRLAPSIGKDGERGAEKDYTKIRKQDVARVLKSAAELAGDGTPSVRDVRKAVDNELGIDRQAKAAETRKERDAGIELADYLRQCIGRIQGITNNLAKVPGESWELLETSQPGLAKRLAKVCDDLAEMMRS